MAWGGPNARVRCVSHFQLFLLCLITNSLCVLDCELGHFSSSAQYKCTRCESGTVPSYDGAQCLACGDFSYADPLESRCICAEGETLYFLINMDSNSYFVIRQFFQVISFETIL